MVPSYCAPVGGDGLALVHVDEGAVHAHRQGPARLQVEHVAVAQQLLGAVHVQDGARIVLLDHPEGDPAGDVGLDHAGQHIDAGPLGGQDQVDAHRPGLLGQAGDRALDVVAQLQHEVGQLVDDGQVVGHGLGDGLARRRR